MLTIELREDFINYYRFDQQIKHKFLKPSKCFTNDKTLFFTSAGMVQLKPYFLGDKVPDENYSVLTNSQFCVRCGGKHNDFEVVGSDSYHLTSFDMLGNWSLNSYWKNESIELAFNYLMKHGLDTNRMYATYFEGNDKIPCDTESRDIWKKYLNESNIIPSSMEDNFWRLADEGPCGVCTEIHYDLNVTRRNANYLVNKNDETLIEIWNVVFVEYKDTKNDDDTSNYELLENRFVDCGMGLQRMAMVLQNKTSLYTTDFYAKLIKYVEILSKNVMYEDIYDINDSSYNKNKAMRIFVDHMRTIVMALYEGCIFDPHNRGFVLKKLAKRMFTNYYLYLNNMHVMCISEHHIIEGMITEILNFNMHYRHDSNTIKQLLILEEKILIGKINKYKLMYNQQIKKNTKENVINKLLSSCDKIKESEGLDKEIIMNLDKLTISK
jgi:alanyl-tRNA synthetase